MHDVHVIDTSSVIQLLDLTPASLWEVFETCTKWVEDGKLVFPTQVELELRSYNVPDSVTVWSAGVRNRRQYPDPDYETVRKVMEYQTVKKVVDWGKASKSDPADPYVLAQAVELQEDGKSVCIVNEDKNDKNDGYGKLKKSSIHTCCAELGITRW